MQSDPIEDLKQWQKHILNEPPVLPERPDRGTILDLVVQEARRQHPELEIFWHHDHATRKMYCVVTKRHGERVYSQSVMISQIELTRACSHDTQIMANAASHILDFVLRACRGIKMRLPWPDKYRLVEEMRMIRG